MERGERVLLAVGLAISTGLLSYACGGSEKPVNAPGGPEKPVQGITADDRSRCDFRGRADREIQEVRGPGAVQPNIRRVYGIIGEGEDRKRLLLCREVDTNLDGMKDVVRTYTDKGEPLNEHADTNFDGKVDTWIAFTRGRVAKVQIDKAGTGTADETRFYVDGKLSRAQRDTNHDGKPDQWEIYDEGQLQRLGVDLDFDGRVDRWDRDEITMRQIEEKERRETEEQEKREQEQKAPTDAGTDARVSARKR
jgi:hypothetical protein